MRFLNEAITLFFLLLHIYTVCVVCTPALKKCMEELNLEFKNSEPIDDFLHGYLYIKYDTVFWDKDTNDNEEVYRGKKRLKKATKGYYFELFYIAQDLDLPLLQSPENFCTSRFENNIEECIRDISLIGCGANVDGFVCFIHLYTQWTKTNEPDTIKGTENLSDDKLLEAICKGSDKFCSVFKKLSTNVVMTKILDVINSISEKFKIIDNLSDKKLLKDSGYEPTYTPDPGLKRFDDQITNFTRYFEKHFPHDYSVEIYDRRYLSNIASSSTSSNEGSSSGPYSDEHMDFFRYSQYMEHKIHRMRRRMNEDGINLEHFYQYHQYKEKERRYKRNLHEVRLRRYGIPDVSYADLCKEFIRRKSVPRSFDIFYTMYIYDTLKDNCDRTRFINHSDYCDKYISG